MAGRDDEDARTGGRLERLADELEQATLALEDAREEATALARERNALAEERSRLARRDAAAEEVRLKFEAATAERASRAAVESTALRLFPHLSA
jgi:hypothetical protein